MRRDHRLELSIYLNQDLLLLSTSQRILHFHFSHPMPCETTRLFGDCVVYQADGGGWLFQKTKRKVEGN